MKSQGRNKLNQNNNIVPYAELINHLNDFVQALWISFTSETISGVSCGD
jgi:hypothetical protein